MGVKTLYIVRHGNTFPAGSTPLRVGAATDLAMTEEGEAQARVIGRWLAGNDVVLAKALSGPLRRTRRTAELILAKQPEPPPLETAAWLDEIDHGPDEWKSESAVIERIGAAALDRWEQHADPPPGWHVDAVRRIAACREGVAALPPGASLLATSNGAARFVLIAFGIEGSLASLKLRTGAMGAVEIDRDRASLTWWDVRPTEHRVHSGGMTQSSHCGR